jgi:hypothetical protein
MIVLFAPTVTVTGAAQIFANGGGGGGGANNTVNGVDGTAPSAPLSAAGGGIGGGPAGVGGAGGFVSAGAQPGMLANESGGGGGGSIGVIRLLSGDISAAQVSPPPT